MSGIDLNHVQKLADACAGTPLTIAGGVRDAEEIAQLDSMGVDAQVGMALYTGAFDLADALGACLNSDRADGLWPTIVANERGAALGLVYSSLESLRAALQEGAGVYHSRSRGLWRKGETSGNRQILKAVDLDCDRDALRFTVQQQGNGFCHTGSQTCFGSLSGLAQLEATLAARARAAPASSYTGRLLSDPALLAQKLREECGELIDARSKLDIAWEAADMLYFTLTRMRAGGVTLRDVERELDRRSLAMTRRGGEAKSEVR